MRSSAYALGVGALLLATVGASGCSSDEAKQEFTVPTSLCGVSVPPKALSRLLPADGSHITFRQDGSVEKGWTLCGVEVDGHAVLNVSQEWIDAGDTARNILRHQLVISDQKSADGGSVAYADRGAASLLKCRGTGVEKEDVSTVVELLKPGRADETAMGELIREYTKSLKARNPCQPD
ncbi:hypothetical protein [Streptomyces sp. LaPpAH-108]|uniref:hypothetical protein n=1 Tax=Streptomyces sp. LaPpAH-108 TaxID=1155714 RepID=UPI000378779F|nr:hypothetical protein [Streptomyces sp. LaPpAH-108]